MTLRLWIGFLLTPAIALLLTSLLCVRSMFRDREPAWLLCLPSTVLGAAGALWFLFGDDIWMPHTWRPTLGALWLLFICAIFPVLAISLLASLFAVDAFRRRFTTMILRGQLHHQHRQQRRSMKQQRLWLNLASSSALVILSSAALILLLTGPWPITNPVGPYTTNPSHYWDDIFLNFPICLSLLGLVIGTLWLAHALASRPSKIALLKPR